MPRIIVLGTGTEVGKSYFAQRLVAELARARPGADVIGIKPIETGVPARAEPSPRRSSGSVARHRVRSSPKVPSSLEGRRSPSHTNVELVPPRGTDAFALEQVSRGALPRPHPLYAFSDPVSPHLAARRERRSISLSKVQRYVALHDTTTRAWQIIESAGGAFSPLGKRLTNVDLARALDPSIWVVVAPDALGVLHDVRATLLALRAMGREPDYWVLSASRAGDASTGTNAAELGRVGLPKPIAVFGRDDDGRAALAPLVRRLLRAGHGRK